MNRDRGTDEQERRVPEQLGSALALAILALALGALAFGLGSGPAAIIMGAAAAVALLTALMLCMRRFVSWLAGLLFVVDVVCVILIAVHLIGNGYTWVGGRLVPRYALTTSLKVTYAYPEHFDGMTGLQTVDMRGSTVTDFSPLYNKTALTDLDVRENYAFTQAEHDALCEALPGCSVRWSVPAGDGFFDSEQRDVDLRAFSLSVDELKSLLDRYPDRHFSYAVPLLGRLFDSESETLNLRGAPADADAVRQALPLLPKVREADLRGLPASVETIASLWDARPDIHFIFSCEIPSGAMTTEDSEMTVAGSYEDLLACLAYVPYMPNLTRIDASAAELSEAEIEAVQAGGYAAEFVYGIEAFGRRISSADTELDLDGTVISGVEEVERCLASLPNLKRISMCGCGLSDEEMGRLFDTYPDVRFVWWVSFGRYTLRTDATAFTTDLWDGNDFNYTSETFAPLRYCADLMMLDLGHNRITSLEAFRGLTKLRVLILADNNITDISPLADMMDLEYVELFLNRITDLTPLADKKNLVDLNLFYNPLEGTSEVLESMTWLKRLWVGKCHLDEEQLERLRQALPDTQIVTGGHSSTGNGWRVHSHYNTLKRMYETGAYIPFDE